MTNDVIVGIVLLLLAVGLLIGMIGHAIQSLGLRRRSRRSGTIPAPLAGGTNGRADDQDDVPDTDAAGGDLRPDREDREPVAHAADDRGAGGLGW